MTGHERAELDAEECSGCSGFRGARRGGEQSKLIYLQIAGEPANEPAAMPHNTIEQEDGRRRGGCLVHAWYLPLEALEIDAEG
jgi:hypothetical protein